MTKKVLLFLLMLMMASNFFAINLPDPVITVEEGEEHNETALREVKEESGVAAQIMKYVGRTSYSFSAANDVINKEVHWYLMMADSYYSRPQREEFFVDSGYYKYHEAYHLLKFSNEKLILEKAYNEYLELKKNHLWVPVHRNASEPEKNNDVTSGSGGSQ